MDRTKSSMKTPTVSSKNSQKRVTFKAELPSINHVSEKLDSAMRYANEIMKLEADNQQMMKEIKGLYSQFHAQCLTRYSIEKALSDKTSQEGVIKGAEEKRRDYVELVAKYLGTTGVAAAN